MQSRRIPATSRAEDSIGGERGSLWDGEPGVAGVACLFQGRKAMPMHLLLSVLTLLFLLGSAAIGQPPSPPATPASSGGAMEQSDNMDKMATTVTRMAEMCEMMMKKEQAAMPYLLAVGITTAVLLFTALVLLIVLQIQWIRYWSWKLRHLGSAADAATLSSNQTKPDNQTT